VPKNEEEHVFVGRTSGNTRLILRIMEVGDDFIFVLTGGDAPHIGAIAVGIPRPSLADPSVTGASVSVFVLTGHKDDELAKPLAMEAARMLGRVVVAVVGIHVNAASQQEIAEIIRVGLELGQEALHSLSF